MESTKASATRSGARLSIPRSRASARKVSGSNQSLERWVREVLMQKLDLALKRCLAERLIDIGASKVPIPLGNLILKDHMVAKRVPGQPRDLAMILVGVIATVREYDVRIDLAFDRLEFVLELSALIGEVAVAKAAQIDLRARRTAQKPIGRLRCFILARSDGAEDHPTNIECDAPLDPIEDRAAATYLDIVRVRAQAENAQRRIPGGEIQAFHVQTTTVARFMLKSPALRHGISPCSTRSSRICRSLSVSIERQKLLCL